MYVYMYIYHAHNYKGPHICNKFIIIVVVIIRWQAVALIRFHRPNKKQRNYFIALFDFSSL